MDRNQKYKVIKMKDLARKFKWLAASEFQDTEAYLSYAIQQMEELKNYRYHQFLYLLDTLYVVLVLKSMEIEKIPNLPKTKKFEDIPRYDVPEDLPKSDPEAPEIKHSTVMRTKLNWK